MLGRMPTRSRRRAPVTLPALVVLALAACATSPTGRTQLMLVSEDTAIAASKTAYQQQLQPYRDKGKIDNEAAMTRRVRGITGRLVAQAIRMRPDSEAWEWSVAVIDDPETVNAWCMAGGRMAIYSGLILKLQATDDEIAQVMGHEIAHALANHTAEKMSMAMASSVGALAVGVATNSAAMAAATAGAAALAINLPNSRGAEREADRIGIELAAKAGYDPRAAITLWDKMGKLGGAKVPEFVSTHPSSDTRKKELSALVPEMMPYYQQKQARPTHRVG